MRHRSGVVSFLHLRLVAISVSYLEGNSLDHERDGSETLDKTNSGWQELAVTFGGPRRRTHDLPHVAISCRHSHSVLLLKKLCLNQYSHTPWAPSEWKGFAPRGQTVPCNHKARHGADAVNRVGADGTVGSRQGSNSRAQRRQRSWVLIAEFFYDEGVHISDHRPILALASHAGKGNDTQHRGHRHVRKVHPSRDSGRRPV
jgi:hypothetical protein